MWISQTHDVIDYYFPFLILFEHCVMMSMLCNCCVRELLILTRTWFAFGLPSKTGCDKSLNMIKDLEIARYNLLVNSVNSFVVCDSETIHPILDSDDLVDRNFQDFSDFNSDLKKMEKKLSRKGRNKNLQKTCTKKKNKTSPKIKCTPNKRGRTRDECSSFNSS
jgi:hypothetical protein